jgi:hypothetical protein
LQIKRSVNIPIKGISSIKYELRENNRQTRERSDISEAIDIVFACKRSRFSDAVLIHLYSKRIKQKKEKIAINKINILKNGEERISTALDDETKIINIEVTTSELTESKTNCNILNLLGLIFERLRINAKRNGTAITFIVDKTIFTVLNI